MILLTAENICKSYGTRIIFDDISFSIHEGDKIGIIGINGTGKSTLLRIVAGVSQADSGQVISANGLRMAYLSQNPEFKEGTTVLQQVFAGENETLHLVRDYEQALEEMKKSPDDKRYIDLTAKLTEKMDKADAWSLESEAKAILTKLGIHDFAQTVETLSGGQRKRVALAAALIAPVDLLILDEPTNHIDNETIEWLEDYLVKYAKALLMVTHDRYFLDRVVNRTIELDRGNLHSYQANYSRFLEMRAEREELESAMERKRQNFLRAELEWVRRGAKARTTKQKARLQRFEEVSGQKMLQVKQSVELSSQGSRLGKKTLELVNVSKNYAGSTYISGFSYIVLRDDRIGIVGENGCGKTTLLKIMTGELNPDGGDVIVGDTVKIGVFSQENEGMDVSMKVIDYIREVAEYIKTGDERISASQLLEKFLFPPDMQHGPISMLSGGEKRRLYLARVLMGAPNILFLDEPTNDLDIETLVILEDYLERFGGAVVIVSHDRYFLDKMVNRIFAFEGEGRIRQYEGGYTDYRDRREEQVQEAPKTFQIAQEQKEKTAISKMSYKDQREFDTIGDTIHLLEESIAQLEEETIRCGSDYVRLQEIGHEKEVLEAKLEATMGRWMELTELAETIAKNRLEYH